MQPSVALYLVQYLLVSDFLIHVYENLYLLRL